MICAFNENRISNTKQQEQGFSVGFKQQLPIPHKNGVCGGGVAVEAMANNPAPAPRNDSEQPCAAPPGASTSPPPRPPRRRQNHPLPPPFVGELEQGPTRDGVRRFRGVGPVAPPEPRGILPVVLLVQHCRFGSEFFSSSVVESSRV